MQDLSSESAFVAVEDFSTQWLSLTLLQKRSHSVLYRAKRYGRWFVLKGLPEELQGLTDCQILQEKEFAMGVQLVHPNIVATYALEEIPQAGKCIVLEAVDGTTLADWLHEKRSRQARLRLLMQLLDAVEYLHQRQLVHHDIKPGNLLVTDNGENLKLIDFGLGNADTDDSPVANTLQDDISSIAGIIDLLGLQGFRSVAGNARQGKYANIAALRNALLRRRRLRQLLPVSVPVAVLLMVSGTLIAVSVRQHRQWQQAYADAVREKEQLEQTYSELLEKQRVEETMIADIDAIVLREQERLSDVCHKETYSELATMIYYANIKWMPLRDSLGNVYKQDPALQLQCLSLLDQRYLQMQTTLMKQIEAKPSFYQQYREGLLAQEEYERLQRRYMEIAQSTQKSN